MNAQKELIKYVSNLTKGGKFEPNKVARLIVDSIIHSEEVSEPKIYIQSPKGQIRQIGAVAVGQGKLRSIINDFTILDEGYWNLKVKVDRTENFYNFKGGKFANELDKIAKLAIGLQVRYDLFDEITDKAFDGFDDDINLGIAGIFELYKQNFAPKAQLANIVMVNLCISGLTKAQKAQTARELGKLFVEENLLAPINNNDSINQLNYDSNEG